MNRLSQEEILYLTSLKGVNKELINEIFSSFLYEKNTYEYNISVFDLDCSLRIINRETYEAIKKGLDFCFGKTERIGKLIRRL